MRKSTIVTLIFGLLAALPLTTPATANAATRVTKSDAGGFLSCAIVSQGRVKCWGDNSGGGLGNGGGSSQDTGVFVNGLSGVRQISASESPCALLGNRTVKCWGPGG
ncbi:MAG: hypothetical protein QOI81_1515, partial [Actinomycetota bacterium]|nr:hypothetical protein [Actinomycetota bacterium]